jgi:hypothetical protein
VSFKNPFDMLDEDEDLINMTTNSNRNYSNASHSDLNPIPFNPNTRDSKDNKNSQSQNIYP